MEQCFGWGKVIGPIRQVMVRGLDKVDALFALTMTAYNLTRMRSLARLRSGVDVMSAKKAEMDRSQRRNVDQQLRLGFVATPMHCMTVMGTSTTVHSTRMVGSSTGC